MLRSRLFSLLYSKVTSEPICNAAQTYATLPQALLRGWSASSASGLGEVVRGLHTSSIQQDFVTLNNISDNPGATKTASNSTFLDVCPLGIVWCGYFPRGGMEFHGPGTYNNGHLSSSQKKLLKALF